MDVTIPQANGVPGISGPPDWLSGTALGNRLDDVRWIGATQRTFGAGASQSASLRAVQGNVGGQQYIFLSLRANFVPSLSDQWDRVYIGLQKQGTTRAMVLRIFAHDATLTSVGPPSGVDPALVDIVEARLRTGVGSWEDVPAPGWPKADARSWLQNELLLPPADANNRWAVNLRIPVRTVGDILDNAGPNLGTDFFMWYMIVGSLRVGTNIQPVLLAHNHPAALPLLPILGGDYPLSADWDLCHLAAGPATTGGVTIRSGDVFVRNIYGDGYQIANGASNTFIVRPRNYTATLIPLDTISATFRIANWGSLAGNPNQVDFTSGAWDYVPGNSELEPRFNKFDTVPALPANSNPPTGSDPIFLDATMTLPPNKSLHQCILVTLSGTSLNFLSSAIFQNMNYDHVSEVAHREAEISVEGLGSTSNGERDVIIAVEKINMPSSIPGGIDEGIFLQASMSRLIAEGGELAEKLALAQKLLQGQGDFGSEERFKALMELLVKAITNQLGEIGPFWEFINTLTDWLPRVKDEPTSAGRLALVCDVLGQVLSVGSGRFLTPDNCARRLQDWLRRLSDREREEALQAAKWLAEWLLSLPQGSEWQEPAEVLVGYLEEPVNSLLRRLLGIFREILSAFTEREPGEMQVGIASFILGMGRWLRGDERLQVFVRILSDAGLSTEDLDRLFPTMRVHVYHDTGERIADNDGIEQTIWRVQSSFGSYAYHEGTLQGWQAVIEEIEQIDKDRYLVRVPDEGKIQILTRIQAIEREDHDDDDHDDGDDGGDDRLLR